MYLENVTDLQMLRKKKKKKNIPRGESDSLVVGQSTTPRQKHQPFFREEHFGYLELILLVPASPLSRPTNHPTSPAVSLPCRVLQKPPARNFVHAIRLASPVPTAHTRTNKKGRRKSGLWQTTKKRLIFTVTTTLPPPLLPRRNNRDPRNDCGGRGVHLRRLC